MAFCANLREADVFFYVSNRASFGHLVDADGFSTEHLNNELWEILSIRTRRRNYFLTHTIKTAQSELLYL